LTAGLLRPGGEAGRVAELLSRPAVTIDPYESVKAAARLMHAAM